VEITEIRVNLRNEEKLKAFIHVTFDNVFIVRGLKVIKGKDGLFVCMPSRKLTDGSYKDIAHPIDDEYRINLENRILEAYEVEYAKGGLIASVDTVSPEEI